MFGCSSFPMSLADRSFDSDGNCVCCVCFNTANFNGEVVYNHPVGSIYFFYTMGMYCIVLPSRRLYNMGTRIIHGFQFPFSDLILVGKTEFGVDG